MLTRIGRSETIRQLEKCTSIMDRLLRWQKLDEATDDFKHLVKELGSELASCIAALTRNLKEHRKEEAKPRM